VPKDSLVTKSYKGTSIGVLRVRRLSREWLSGEALGGGSTIRGVPDATPPRATGRCLCGAVTYEVRGQLRDIVLCHCIECRRWSGSAGAFAGAHNDDLVMQGDSLRWVVSPESSRNAKRAFCAECGSSLFWKAADAERTGIAAGTLDEPTGLRITAHIYTHQAADWDALPNDGIARDPDASYVPRWS
jgi:hypothetical protein